MQRRCVARASVCMYCTSLRKLQILASSFTCFINIMISRCRQLCYASSGQLLRRCCSWAECIAMPSIELQCPGPGRGNQQHIDPQLSDISASSSTSSFQVPLQCTDYAILLKIVEQQCIEAKSIGPSSLEVIRHTHTRHRSLAP